MAGPWDQFAAPSSATAPAVSAQGFDDTQYAPAPSSSTAPVAPSPAPASAPTQAVQPASRSPGPWSSFTTPSSAAPHPLDAYPAAPPTAAAPNSGYRFVDPYPAPDGNGMTTVAPDQYADFVAGKAAPTVPDGKISGVVANAAAGANSGLATILGAPMDLSNGIRNLAVRGINAVAGTSIPLTGAIGGSNTVKQAMGVVGANPDDVVAATPTQSLVRAGAEGATMALAPEAGGAALVGSGLATAAKAAPIVERLGGATLGNVAAGVGSGVGSQAAASVVPDNWKPVAGLVGGLIGGGAVAVPAAALQTSRNALSGLADNLGIAPRNALLDNSGTALVDSTGKPIAVTSGQAQAAGQRLDAAASDPDAVRQALATPTVTTLQSPATTFQLTGDTGLGDLERGVSQTDNRPFLDLQNQQNAARVQARDALVPPSANSADAAAAFQQQRDALGASDQATVDQARGNLSGAMDTLGGAPAGTDSATALQQYGQALRAPLAAGDAAAKKNVSDLADVIDPDGNLATNMQPIRARANEILQGISPNAEQPAGKEAGILQTAQNLPDVQSFKDLKALRTRLTNALMQERGPTGDPEAVRRMSMLLDGVHDAMADTVSRPDVTVPAAPASSVPTTAPNVGSDVFTPSGQRVGVQYQVADAPSLVTSHNADMSVNPAYPPQLQPRARDRAASEVQVANIASRLQPERLGASNTVADGAPIVGPDGVVESGNGRVMALRRAYSANGPQAQSYRDWLADQGHDTTGMAQPVLIRRRVTPLSPDERVAFADGGNAPTTLAMSATERAAQDARRLPDEVLHQFQPGDVTDPANRDAVRGFVRNVVEPGQEGNFVTGDGQLSQEGASRVRAALVHRAYGSDGLSAALAESTDPTAKVLAGAMQDAAGPMARLKAGIQAGHVDPSVDIAPHLVEAAQTVAQARAKGISLADQVGQRDMLNGGVSPQADRLLREAYGPDLSGRMSRAQFSDMLSAYARRAGEQSTAGNLFGANLTRDELLDGVASRYGKTAEAGGGASGRSTASPAGSGAGAYGDQARGSVAGSQRETAPSGGSGQGGPAGRILEQPPSALTPNFDQAAADRYQAMRSAHADRKDTFGPRAPGVGPILAQGPTSGSFRMPDSAVVGQLVRGGAGTAERVQAFLKAGGSAADLADAAAYSFRQAAENAADGTLNPTAAARWQRAHSELLTALPDFNARLATATGAQDALDAAAATQTATRRAYEESAAGKFLGDADPKRQVATILGANNAQAQMHQLAQLTANSPAARMGLQRAVVDHLTSQMQGDRLAGQTGTTQLSGAALQKFVRQKGPALAEIMDPQQMRVLHDIAADIQRSDQSANTVLKNGSATTQNLAAASRVSAGSTLLHHVRQHGMETLVGTGTGAAIGGSAGGALFGVPGAMVGGSLGGAVGTLAGKVANSMKAANIATVDGLVREAVLNPGLAHVLLSRVTPETAPNVGQALAATLRRSIVMGAAMGAGQADKPSASRRPPATVSVPYAPMNALAGLGSAHLAPARTNALMALPR